MPFGKSGTGAGGSQTPVMQCELGYAQQSLSAEHEPPSAEHTLGFVATQCRVKGVVAGWSIRHEAAAGALQQSSFDVHTDADPVPTGLHGSSTQYARSFT